RGRPGRAKPQPRLRVGRGRRPSRPAEVSPVNLPLGFSFAGVHAGIKPFKKDLALVVSETPAAAAGCFTPNRARAAAVRDTAARLPGRMRAVVVHSGNANALTGAQGDRDARAVVEATARALGCAPEEVVSAGTGVIGVPLPVPL